MFWVFLGPGSWQVALEMPQSLQYMEEYKHAVESVLPWHSQIHQMAKEYLYFCHSAKQSFPKDMFRFFAGVGLVGVHEDVAGAFLFSLRTKGQGTATTNVRKLPTLKNLWWQTKAGMRCLFQAMECPSVFRARSEVGLKIGRIFNKFAKEDMQQAPVKAYLLEGEIEQFCMEAIWYHMKVAWEIDLAIL